MESALEIKTGRSNSRSQVKHIAYLVLITDKAHY